VADEPRGLDLEAAADAIGAWGFLAGGRPLGDPRPGYLLVALRRRPTLDHFDPELVRFWVREGPHAVRWELDRHSPAPWEHELSWGRISIRDRLRVHNDYLTFGGVVTCGRTRDTTVALFLSSAPLLRAGGHSQIRDPGSDALGAFFARLGAAAGQSVELDAAIARADPIARYAAFVAWELANAPPPLGAGPSADELAAILRAERDRLTRTDPTRWQDGELLVQALEHPALGRLLATPGPNEEAP
jgi:hypothetical protein